MVMIPVVSSNIASIGYENSSMHVSFKSGGLYGYTNVPENIYKAFISAGSKGKYFRSNISKHYGEHKIR